MTKLPPSTDTISIQPVVKRWIVVVVVLVVVLVVVEVLVVEVLVVEDEGTPKKATSFSFPPSICTEIFSLSSDE